jgi:lipase chaperone LimK
VSSGYREDRRVDAVRRLSAVTKNEAGTMTDIERQRRYESEREAIADDLRRQGEKPKRSFAALVARKP